MTLKDLYGVQFAGSSLPSQPEPVLVVGAGPAGATAARPGSSRRSSSSSRSRGVSEEQALRRRDQHPRASTVSLISAARAAADCTSHGFASSTRRARRTLDGDRIGRARRADDSPRRIRRAARLARRRGRSAAHHRRRDRAGARGPDSIVVTSRDGRTFTAPIVIAADGVHSVVARRLGLNRGWPARSVALDMMEETPRQLMRDVDPSTLWVAYGYASSSSPARAQGHGRMPEGYAYVFPKRDHVNIGIGYVLSHYREAWTEEAVRAAAGADRHAARPRDPQRRFRARELHAVPDPGRRSAARNGARPCPAGGRRRRLRQRVHGRGHLLRDGVRRGGGPGGPPVRGIGRAARGGLPAELRPGNRRGAARCRDDPAVSVRRSPALRPDHGRRASRRPSCGSSSISWSGAAATARSGAGFWPARRSSRVVSAGSC